MDQILIKSVVSSSDTGDCGLKPYCLAQPLAISTRAWDHTRLRCPSYSRVIEEAVGPCVDLNRNGCGHTCISPVV